MGETHSLVALRRRDAEESVTAIAERLGVGRSTLHRTLVSYDEAAAATDAPRITAPRVVQPDNPR
ncbi:helix-turn-helix domain-containing protein [Streptomyces sp. NPDC048424]|uniref:helix-turn-helix domain-containing protein n=1 Tax=Streptomyces sp. NPDC048424 TaxID=3155265 RepID=UPI003442D4A1